MSFEWPIVHLGDHVDSCLGKMLDAKKNKGSPQPYLGNSNVRWGNFDLMDLAEMRFEAHEEERYSLVHGDLVVCEGGEPGRCAIWTQSIPGMKIQKALHRIRPKATLNNYYIFYWFQYAAKLGLLDQYFTGTTIKHLTGRAISKLKIPLPPIKTQVAMVDILRSLDDRIALLRETNSTLESIAQALFKSWFVDFDPVHANAGTQAPSLPPEIQSLFPSTFVESPLGLVPEGWGVDAVYNLANYINGAAYKAFEPNADRRGLPIIKIAELKAGVTAQTAYSDIEMNEKYRIDNKEVLFSWSGNPDTSIDTFVWLHGKAWLNQHIFKVVPHEAHDRSFVLLMLKYLNPVFAEIARDKQTTGLGHVTVADLKRLQIAKPRNEILFAWNEIVDPIIERSYLVMQKANTLSQLRDTLLPRLISGQLRLPEVEALAEAAL